MTREMLQPNDRSRHIISGTAASTRVQAPTTIDQTGTGKYPVLEFLRSDPTFVHFVATVHPKTVVVLDVVHVLGARVVVIARAGDADAGVQKPIAGRCQAESIRRGRFRGCLIQNYRVEVGLEIVFVHFVFHQATRSASASASLKTGLRSESALLVFLLPLLHAAGGFPKVTRVRTRTLDRWNGGDGDATVSLGYHEMNDNADDSADQNDDHKQGEQDDSRADGSPVFRHRFSPCPATR